VPEGDRSRIFERFVRVDDARDRDAGGSGLGLAIVREVAAAHGASVRVTDGTHGGARFEVDFPAPSELGPSGSFRGRSDPPRHDRGDPDGAPVEDPRRQR
jgi:signal transduction histidine kinase